MSIRSGMRQLDSKRYVYVHIYIMCVCVCVCVCVCGIKMPMTMCSEVKIAFIITHKEIM